MAGSIPLSLQTIFDNQGEVLSGGRVYFIQAGTVGTPQNAFQDSGLVFPWPNYYTLPASGRLPLLYFADGYIKVRITDENGVQVFNQDNIPVTGFSSGGGGGGTVDPTTVIQTGWVQPIYGTGVVSGFVRLAGRTIGNASSGATERANADTVALFTFLYNADVNLAVSGGRGASAAVDYAANKALTLPDFRGRIPAGLGDMGNGDAGLLSAAFFGASGTTLGAVGGAQASLLVAGNVPSLTSVNATQSISVTSTINYIVNDSGNTTSSNAAGGANRQLTSNGAVGSVTSTGNNSISVTYTNASPTGFRTVQPTILLTFYIKL